MSKSRSRFPHLGDRLFITDGGLETALVHGDGVQLRSRAAFPLLDTAAGRERLKRYYARYAQLAREQGVGLVLESPTWRASADWGAALGYDAGALVRTNRAAVDLMLELRADHESASSPMPISGRIGPRGDGFQAARRMSVAQARDYHAPQVHTFAASQADLVSGFTLAYVEEAIGIVSAARACGIPTVISFTVETDGHLPSGDALAAAIDYTDAETDGYAAYYMVDCAHPAHFLPAFDRPGAWQRRVRGLRANASRRSHAELATCADLDDGDPTTFGLQHADLRWRLPWLCVLGGCCGADHRHLEAICRSLRHGLRPHPGASQGAAAGP